MSALPRFPYHNVPPRFAAELHAQMVRKDYPLVHCTLPDLERAVDAERLAAYELSQPTLPSPGRRWITRPPACWEAWSWCLMLRPVYLLEVTDVTIPSLPSQVLVWCWRIEIEGEALAQAWLRSLGPVRGTELARLVTRHRKQGAVQ